MCSLRVHNKFGVAISEILSAYPFFTNAPQKVAVVRADHIFKILAFFCCPNLASGIKMIVGYGEGLFNANTSQLARFMGISVFVSNNSDFPS